MAWDLAIPIIDMATNAAFFATTVFPEGKKDTKKEETDSEDKSKKLPRKSLEKLSSTNDQMQEKEKTDIAQEDPNEEGLLSKISNYLKSLMEQNSDSNKKEPQCQT